MEGTRGWLVGRPGQKYEGNVAGERGVGESHLVERLIKKGAQTGKRRRMKRRMMSSLCMYHRFLTGLQVQQSGTIDLEHLEYLFFII